MDILPIIFIGILSGYIAFREIMFAKERAEWMKMLGSRPLSTLQNKEIVGTIPDDMGGKNTIAEPDNTIALEDVPNPYDTNPNTKIHFTN